MTALITRAAALLEDFARMRPPGMVWRDLAIEASKVASELRASLAGTKSIPVSEALTNPPLGTPESARDIVQTIALAMKNGYTPNEILDENSPIAERIRAEARTWVRGSV